MSAIRASACSPSGNVCHRDDHVYKFRVDTIDNQIPAELLALLFRRDLRKADSETYKRYFLMSGGDKIVPKSSGYCIGYFAISEASKTMNMTALTEAKEETIYRVLEEALLGVERN